MERKTFKDFKKFLCEECAFLNLYKDGKYDRKIYDWFKTKKKKLTPKNYGKQ